MSENAQGTQPEQSTIIQPTPEGFTLHLGPDDRWYLVPQFMVPSLNQAFASYHHKVHLGVVNEDPWVSEGFITNIVDWPIGISTQPAFPVDRHPI
jgi:hypothetical protein